MSSSNSHIIVVDQDNDCKPIVLPAIPPETSSEKNGGDNEESKTLKYILGDNNSDNKIDFMIDLTSLKEKDSASELRGSLNQKADIFNTLLSIKEKLENGEKPTEAQMELVNNYNQFILDKFSK